MTFGNVACPTSRDVSHDVSLHLWPIEILSNDGQSLVPTKMPSKVAVVCLENDSISQGTVRNAQTISIEEIAIL